MPILAAASLLLAATAATNTATDAATNLKSQFEELKSRIHLIPKSQAKAELEKIRLHLPPPHQGKIDHFVVLLMENHAFDNVLGCMNLPGVDGVPKEGFNILKDASDPSKGFVTVACGTPASPTPNVCIKPPKYSMFDLQFKKGSNMHTFPYDKQNYNNSFANGADATAIHMFSPDEVPVKYQIAQEFGIFNKLFTAVPSASQPNHLFVQSATSCGTVDNILYNRCGGSTGDYPQMTLYDSLFVHNVSFALYMNSTCGIKGTM